MYSFPGFISKTPVEDYAARADKKRQGEHSGGKNIVLRAEGISAHGGGDYTGQPAQRADKQPQRKSYIGQSRKIAEKNLWRAGYHKNNKKKQIPFGRAFKKSEGAELFP